jgi:hypothetical protein
MEHDRGWPVQQAKPFFADPMLRLRPESPGRDAQPELEADRIVPLFGAPPAAPGQGAEADHDWLATLDLVRRISARVRHAEESSREIARNAQAYLQNANERIEEARTRAEAAEATARTAERRAQDAEARAIQAEERVQAAERRAQAAQAQVQGAEARVRDAQAWAKRLHHTLRQEFGADADAEPEPVGRLQVS